jgi:hypothetical protein
MKVKITIDSHALSTARADAIANIASQLGSNATISGNVITVEEGMHENRVTDILKRKNIGYSRARS